MEWLLPLQNFNQLPDSAWILTAALLLMMFPRVPVCLSYTNQYLWSNITIRDCQDSLAKILRIFFDHFDDGFTTDVAGFVFGQTARQIPWPNSKFQLI